MDAPRMHGDVETKVGTRRRVPKVSKVEVP